MNVTGEQLRAARAMARIEQSDLASAANVSVDTIKRLERSVGPVSANVLTVEAIVRVLEASGIEFTNGSQPGVKLSGWFVERYEHDGTKAAEVRYVRDCQALLAALKDWKIAAPEGSRFRLHAPASATSAEREAIHAAGGVWTA